MQDKFMATLKVGTKGQIVIPKEVRSMFGINPGDTVLLMADTNRGIAIVNYDEYKAIAEAILSDKKAGFRGKNE